MQRIHLWIVSTIIFPFCFCITSQSIAQSKAVDESQSDAYKWRKFLRPGGRRGVLILNRHVYYPGDTISVKVKIPKKIRKLGEEEVDAHIVVALANGEYVVNQIVIAENDRFRQVYDIPDIDTTVVPEGFYQFALIVTTEGGDPLDLNDWYNNFLGLVSVAGARISPEFTADDVDGDGELDDDVDEDGYSDNDDEDDELDDDSDDDSDDNSDDSTGDGTGD